MKNIYLSLIIAAGLFGACQPKKEGASSSTDEQKPVTLTKKWETDAVLTTCEAVLYDKDRDVLYVSNINGTPDQKDGNGSIAKVSLDGKVIDPTWVKGMDAPKGMGLIKDVLYVTDIDRVHEIDINTGKITRTHKVEGASFLNDISTTNDGKVFISDTGAGTISLIENGTLAKWLENLDGPNGVYADGGKLFMVLWNGKTFNSVDISSKEISVKADSIENGDGIEPFDNGAFLVSSWNGMVHHIDKDGRKTLILDTRADSVNAADIEFVKDKNLLLVPAFFKNKVVAYEISKN